MNDLEAALQRAALAEQELTQACEDVLKYRKRVDELERQLEKAQRRERAAAGLPASVNWPLAVMLVLVGALLGLGGALLFGG